MNKQIKISEVKDIAKEQLLGNYKVAVLSFAIICIGAFALMMVVSTSMIGFIPGAENMAMGNVSEVNPLSLYSIIIFLLMAICEALITVFSIGMKKINLDISRGEKADFKDLLYGVRNHPDKVIVMFFIVMFIELIITLGVEMARVYFVNISLPENVAEIIVLATGLVTRIITYLILISFSQMYYVYLDSPDKNIKFFIKESFRLMKGNRWKLICFYISMIGWWILGILSLGVGFLWIIPYQNVSLACFYRSIKGEINSRFERTV